MRQYIAQSRPDRAGLLTVTGKDYRYMKQVLRLSVGDMVDVRLPADSSSPAGSLQQMTVCRIDEKKRQIVLQICAATPATADDSSTGISPADYSPSSSALGGAPAASGNSLPELWLFQFVARSAKMDTIVRQATECGVRVIVPVAGDFSQAGARERNFRGDRYARIIKEARQQSGSAVATEVYEACSLKEAIDLWQERCRALCGQGETSETQLPGTFACLLYERTEQTQSLHGALARALQRGGPKNAAAAADKAAPATEPADQPELAATGRGVQLAAMVCGAEGGISPEELTTLMQAGFVPLHFKTNILRCETAALYGIAALQSALAEGNIWQCKE